VGTGTTRRAPAQVGSGARSCTAGSSRFRGCLPTLRRSGDPGVEDVPVHRSVRGWTIPARFARAWDSAGAARG
jgi:hypothetical protein